MPKQGKLSRAEQIYIKEHMDKKTVTQMAKSMFRTPEQIDKWIQTQKETAPKELPTPEALEVVVKEELKDTPAWKALSKELTNEERKRFEYEYGSWLSQFKDRIEASIRTQLFQMLKLEILISRNLVDQKNLREEIKQGENDLRVFITGIGGQENATDIQRAQIIDLKNHISQLRATISSLTSEYQKMLGESKHILKDLNATRTQIIDQLEDKDISWLGLIKELESADMRAVEGRAMSLIKKAAEKELRRLSKPYKYANGSQDIPVLTAESVAELQKEESNV